MDLYVCWYEADDPGASNLTDVLIMITLINVEVDGDIISTL